ncbi:MAG TPA: hypothetical protein QGF05_13570 [Dehalococcoidia bacterium]|nr:hypothetical protein [Dehalococcoidia bacterium]
MPNGSRATRPIRTTASLNGDRVEIVRDGARLVVRTLGDPLSERRARRLCAPALEQGERLLDYIESESTAQHPARATTFTFVVWPRTASHTSSLLS